MTDRQKEEITYLRDELKQVREYNKVLRARAKELGILLADLYDFAEEVVGWVDWDECLTEEFAKRLNVELGD